MADSIFSCGACKFLRRRCTSECVFTPYFCYSQGADHFAAVHKIFGASNASKLLTKLPLEDRSGAAISILYEAMARMHDPVYGCVAEILALEQQVAGLQQEIDQLENHMAYVSFGLPNYESFQEIGDMNTGLPFSFDHDMSNCDHLTPPLLAAPQASSSPSLCISEGGFTISCSFLDQPPMENGCSI